MGHYFTNDNNLQSNIKKLNCFIFNEKMTFYTDNGVFSKNEIDFGSRLLLNTIINENLGSNILDVGCGYGTIGISISKCKKCKVTMCDVNKRALHLAEMNIKENSCFDIEILESNCYENINGIYSSIVTNPPIRAGKKIVYEILERAKDYLEENGALYFVVRKEQGAKSIISDMQKLYNVEVLEKKKGFFIVKCTF